MKKLISFIPNILTLLNLTFGVLGILFFQHDLIFAAVCLYIAMVFDFFDGFAAKFLNATSEIGKQLDSLADLVSFGVLPACILFGVMHPDFIWLQRVEIPIISYFVIIIPIFSAFRLAKFNLDETQKYGFKGLPTPANAFWIASIPLILNNVEAGSVAYEIYSNRTIIVILSVCCAFLLVIPVPLMALKFKSLKFKENPFRYIFILTSIVLFIIFKWLALPFLIVVYIVFSLMAAFREKKLNPFNNEL